MANSCEMMLQRATVLEQMAEENKGLWNIVKNWLKKWAAQLQEAFQGVSAVHDESRAVEAMEAERLRKFTETWYRGLFEASENAQKSPAKKGGEVKYSIDPYFEQNLNTWIQNGRKTGTRIRVGTTSAALQAVGLPKIKIYWWSNSINHSQNLHPEISDEVLKQVPALIEKPILIMTSKTQANSVTILYYSSIKTIDNPGAAGNAPNGIRRKITNRITEPENHFFQSREDLVAKPHLAKLFPDLLNGIHLGRIRRNRDELYVVGNTQSL